MRVFTGPIAAGIVAVACQGGGAVVDKDLTGATDVDAGGDADTDADSDADSDVGSAVAGELVITEIMADPLAVDGDLGEYVEVTSTATRSLDLIGLTFTDDDDTGFTVTRSLVVAPGGVLLFAPSANAGLNGGLTVDYAYDVLGVKLGNQGDTLTILNAGSLIDEVQWDPVYGGWPQTEGVSITLDPAFTDAVENDLVSHWCQPTGTYGAGDRGSPGEANDPC
jgi:hypothetical protein